VDEDRPVSRVYRDEQVAELDELEPEDERPIRPRIRGVGTCVQLVRMSTRMKPLVVIALMTTRIKPDLRIRGSVERRQGDRPRKQRRSRPQPRPIERPQEDEWGSPQRSNDDGDVSDGVSKSPSSVSMVPLVQIVTRMLALGRSVVHLKTQFPGKTGCGSRECYKPVINQMTTR